MKGIALITTVVCTLPLTAKAINLSNMLEARQLAAESMRADRTLVGSIGVGDVGE